MATPDFRKPLGFAHWATHSYIKHIHRDGSWDQGTLVKGDDTIQVSVCSTALNYGQSCFEGLKAFKQRDGKIRLFRPQSNAARLQTSCLSVHHMPLVPPEVFLDACKRVILDNLDFVPPYGSGGSLYLRPLVFANGAELGLNSPREFTFLVFCNPVSGYYAGASKTTTKALVMDGFDRASPFGMGHVKVAGNYAPTIKPTEHAKSKGYTVLLFLDPASRSYVEEFATSNFAALTKPDANGKRTYVTPKSRSVLPSITNRTLAELAEKRFGWSVQVRPIPYLELTTFDEWAACGTAVIVTPINEIHREVYEGASEPEFVPGVAGFDAVWKEVADRFASDKRVDSQACPSNTFDGFGQLKKALVDIQTGDAADAYGWCWPKIGL